ncbi:MAG: FliM/FliN family flagellar motor switch protein [Candidatus Thiodiazotropha sp. (ex Dulcina madagascariensis)]|nr:FliM/FliN family flagellar motor switch protein [Candidatus Thiodiazotropha sp. (ex Epidulcina cf. delphinae)]MCU7922526.1 FliM/FliN family flagellar motor switch protein [Candidatus Thiodiazotropha sp. (ex Dulcina madagascariensis)]MCU7925847.1 FliM/FliN family flagellar motor switch protein [Candidatus Thiodiazotropha sp. (ex Dulcina madagascariensis)]
MSDAIVDNIELNELTSTGHSIKKKNKVDMSKLKNIKVQVEVFLGRAELTVGELTELGKQSIVKLDRGVNEYVEIILEGETIALGTLVAAGDNFGVHIREIKD